MCGIIGIYLEKITPEQLEKVVALIHESSIRGVHATGISCLQDGRINTMKSHISADNLLSKANLADLRDTDNGLYLIAHTRYSTSDIKYNQPIGDEYLVISHNGVISQETPVNWKEKFHLETETSNDSELIYVCLKSGTHPLHMFDGSMAVCTLSKLKILHFFRNNQRPLWYVQEPNGVVVASTKDILERSGFKDPIKCKMFTDYTMREGTITSKLYPTAEGVVDLQ